MLNDERVSGPGGDALVWIIDEDCLYDLAVLPEYVSMFTEYDEIVDVSENYEDHDGITIRFIKGDNTEIDFQTSEYFGSILLSNPQIKSLLKYPYGQYVVSPNAKFDGEKFIITNRDISGYPAWHLKNPYIPEEYLNSL
jgi:hypothetical protein